MVSRDSYTDEVGRHADLIVPAVPTHRFRALDPERFAGKILVDAMNHWETVDGANDELERAGGRLEHRRPGPLPVGARRQEPRPARLPRAGRAPPAARRAGRIAVGAAGADRVAVRRVMRLVDRRGFDAVDGGRQVLEPDGSPYAVTYTAGELSRLVSR